MTIAQGTYRDVSLTMGTFGKYIFLSSIKCSQMIFHLIYILCFLHISYFIFNVKLTDTVVFIVNFVERERDHQNLRTN